MQEIRRLKTDRATSRFRRSRTGWPYSSRPGRVLSVADQSRSREIPSPPRGASRGVPLHEEQYHRVSIGSLRTKSQRRYVIKWVTQVNPRPATRVGPRLNRRQQRASSTHSSPRPDIADNSYLFGQANNPVGAWKHFLPHFLGLTIPLPDDGYTGACRSVRRTGIDRSYVWSWQLPLAFPPAGSADPFLCRPESTCEGRRMLLVWVTQSRSTERTTSAQKCLRRSSRHAQPQELHDQRATGDEWWERSCMSAILVTT